MASIADKYMNRKTRTYEEAVSAVEEIGVLPFASLVPNHPSLESITFPEQWHNGSDPERDPWLWRARFPEDGAAAYGKFFRKKSILISRELFPWVKAVLGSASSLQERYEEGLVSRAALSLYSFIEAEPGIETRSLRTESGLNATSMKKTYDQAIVELQGSVDIVISGAKEKRNVLGEKNGWSSTSFDTAAFWMGRVGLDPSPVNSGFAKEQLRARLTEICSTEAMNYFRKLFSL